MKVPKNKTILFASSNSGKLIEIKEVAERFGIDVIGVKEFVALDSSKGKNIPNIEENGSSYLENAKLKADAYFIWSGMPCLSDDSGLEVDALHGKPGIGTARYAGENATSQDNINKLLAVLDGKDLRTARFRCLLYFKITENEDLKAEGILEGSIAKAPRGKAGFGYDPIFELPGMGKTLAELKSGETVKTHRILACENIFEQISKLWAAS